MVGGSGKDVGKTALVCAVIAALREFGWTAVKITGHDYGGESAAIIHGAIREETVPGQETDTARYLAAGARRALLVTRNGQDVPMDEIRRGLGRDRNVIFESNRIVDVLKPDVCVALVGHGAERKASFLRLLHVADAVVSAESFGQDVAGGVRRFRLESVDRLPEGMEGWLRERIGNA